MSETVVESDRCFAEVCAVLNREFAINALSSLVDAMRFELSPKSLTETVITFDANVILRLSGHRRGQDIVDYLRTIFAGHIILPGQVVQEFWNNQFQAVDTSSTAIKKKVDELSVLVDKIDARYGDYRERFHNLLQDFKEEFGYIFDDNTIRMTKLFLELLMDKADVPFMPRAMLVTAANVRKRTKTPPGFKDDLDGDFYVWSDLLLGLVKLRKNNVNVQRVIMVTLDKKIDWSRDGVPHPILTAEINAICGAQFETIDVDALARRLLD